MKDFVHVHSHTNLGSMLDSLADVNELFEKAKEFGQKALAITDHGTLTAHYDAFMASKKTGVKFIPGCEMYFVNSYGIINEGEKGRKKTERRKHLVLLAPNKQAYQNLLKLNYIGFQNQVFVMGRSFPRINWTDLENNSDQLICTSACANGPVARLLLEDDMEGAIEIALRLNDIFKDKFFIEIQPHLLKDEYLDQNKLNQQLIYIANKHGIPLVVGVDVHYLTHQSQVYHDVLLAVKDKKPVDDPTRHRYGIDEFYMKSGDEVYGFLAKHYGVRVAEEAVNNTVAIANMCEEPDYINQNINHLPKFVAEDELDYQEFLEWRKNSKIPKQLEVDKAFMRFRCIKRFKEKFAHLPKEERKKRWDRVLEELKVLEGNNFSSYMLVVADIIQWAKNNRITVGPGRGSVGSTLIGYLLNIHSIDPLQYDLFFERFQNAHKKDLPDIDTDFTSAGRDMVKDYCRKKYGESCCAHISNFNTYTPKNTIPDLVKSMRNVMPGLIKPGQHYVAVSDAIKAEIPDQDDNGKVIKTLEKALEMSKGLRSFADKSPELMKYATQLVGLPKEYGVHAAGFIIADKPIIDVAPLRIDKNGQIAVQYEKNRCESLGLVKMDFLAISTLDIMDETLKNIKDLGLNGPQRLEDISLDDKETFNMIKKGHTKCVFQLGKSGMMVSLCKIIKPENITDIAIINALGRPSSSKEERIDFAKRRFGKKEITYLHSSLENSLKRTYGIGIFEEQLMGIAKDVAGWDLSKADGLRKLTKLKGKNPKLALQLETDFIEGTMKKHGTTYEEATNIWEKVVAPWAGYGFNKCLGKFNYVYTPEGYKAFANLNVGDKIYVFDKKKNQLKKSHIKDIGKNKKKMEVYEINFASCGKTQLTLNHKLLTPFGYKDVSEIIKRMLPVKLGYNGCVDWNEDINNPCGLENNRINKFLSDGYSAHATSKLTSVPVKRVVTISKSGKTTKRKKYGANPFNGPIDSEEKAYWYGFLCADGYTSTKRTSCGLANYDFSHLEKMALFFNVENPHYNLRKCNNSCSVTLDINNKDIASSLILKGININKSKCGFDFSCVPKNLFKHFIRGYFDGDGSVATFNFKGPRMNVGFRGKEDVLSAIRNHLSEVLGFNKNKISFDSDSCSLWYRSLKDVKTFYNYIYNGSVICLARKRIKMERFFNHKDIDYKCESEEMFRGEVPEGYTTIKSVDKMGTQDTYYIEVDDENHNYILDGGVVSANSHAVLYSINSYYSAYLKCHFPACFLAAYLKVRTDRGGVNKDDEVSMAKQECRRMGVKIVPPDINRSSAGYEVLDKNTVVMGLSAIKGMGEKAVSDVIENQPFNSFAEFLSSTNARVVNKSKLEVLAKAGCFDSLDLSRKAVFEEGKLTREKMTAFVRKKAKEGLNSNIALEQFSFKLSEEEWDKSLLLQNEQDVLGEIVSGSINEMFPGFFTGYRATPISRLKTLPDRHNIAVEFVVMSMLREFKIKSGRYMGQKMIKFRVSDIWGAETELTVWPTEYKKAKELMLDGRPVRAQCQVSEFNGTKTLMLRSIDKVYFGGKFSQKSDEPS